MATYDPNKTYTWGPETKFVISGQDFSLMLHTIRGILSTKEATNTILAYEFNKKIEEMMASGVAEGKVVEAQQEAQHPVGPEEIPFEEVKESKPTTKDRKLSKA
jgi:hypothetical protein